MLVGRLGMPTLLYGVQSHRYQMDLSALQNEEQLLFLGAT